MRRSFVRILAALALITSEASLGGLSHGLGLVPRSQRSGLVKRRRVQAPATATDRIAQVTIGAYVAQVARPSLAALGARSTRLILRAGQWWRLATPMLLHGSPAHLMVNMLALRNVGGALACAGVLDDRRFTSSTRRRDHRSMYTQERAYGSKRTALVYALAGVGGNVLPVVLKGMSDSALSVGASGAVAGLVGALAVHLYRHSHLYGTSGLKSIRDTVLMNAALGMTSHNVDNLAHLGGLLTGAASAYVFGANWVRPYEGAQHYVDRPLVRLP